MRYDHRPADPGTRHHICPIARNKTCGLAYLPARGGGGSGSGSGSGRGGEGRGGTACLPPCLECVPLVHYPVPVVLLLFDPKRNIGVRLAVGNRVELASVIVLTIGALLVSRPALGHVQVTCTRRRRRKELWAMGGNGGQRAHNWRRLFNSKGRDPAPYASSAYRCSATVRARYHKPGLPSSSSSPWSLPSLSRTSAELGTRQLRPNARIVGTNSTAYVVFHLRMV